MNGPEKNGSQSMTPAADFAPATQETWRKLVDGVLKGAPFSRLESHTYDGLPIEPLYPRATDAHAIPGRAPGAAWTIMQRADHPDPAAANAQALDDLENGATGLILIFAGSISSNGFGLDPSAATLARVLDGVDLTAIAIDLNLGPTSRHIVREFPAYLKQRGVAADAVDLRLSINPIGGFAAAGKSAQSWDELAKSFAGMIGELTDGRISRPVRGCRRPGDSQCRWLGSAGACFRSGKRCRLSARAGGERRRASKKRATRFISGCPPMPSNFSPWRNSARCRNCGRASKRPAG